MLWFVYGASVWPVRSLLNYKRLQQQHPNGRLWANGEAVRRGQEKQVIKRGGSSD